MQTGRFTSEKVVPLSTAADSAACHTQARVDLGPALEGAGFPTPVPAGANPMPTHESSRG
jgi:hypothetical protein